MSEFVRGVVGKAVIYAAFGLFVCLALLLIWEATQVPKLANDFGVYWRTANEPVSEAYLWRGAFPFPYAPTMLLWIAPLALIPKWPAFFIFSALGIVALVLACRPYLTKAALALLLISPPVVRCIRNGQVSALLAALMIWACGTPNRIAAGAAFGVVASIKPQLVIMAPLMFVLNKDWRAFNAAWATFLAIVVVVLAVFGVERWPEWYGSMDHFHSAVTETRVILIAASPAIVAEKFGLNPIPFLVAGTFCGAALVYFCRNAEGLEKATAIGAGSLLAAPYALNYDLVIIAPFLAMQLMKGRLPALIGLSGMLNPAPIIAAVYELARLTPRERLSGDGISRVRGVARHPYSEA